MQPKTAVLQFFYLKMKQRNKVCNVENMITNLKVTAGIGFLIDVQKNHAGEFPGIVSNSLKN